jgi:hypothetical protein
MRRDLEVKTDLKEKDAKITILKDENKILKATLSEANTEIDHMDKKLDQKEIIIVSLQKELLEKDIKYENLVKIEKRKINFSEITCGENTSDSNFLSTLIRERSGVDKDEEKRLFGASGSSGGGRNVTEKNKVESNSRHTVGNDRRVKNVRNYNKKNSSTTENRKHEKSSERKYTTDYAEESKSKMSQDGEYNYDYDYNHSNNENRCNGDSALENKIREGDDDDSDVSEMNENNDIEDFEKSENFKEELIRLLKEKEIEMKKSMDKMKGKKNKSAYIAKSKELIYFQKIISMSKKIKNLKEKIIDRKYWKRVAVCVAEAAVHTCAGALSVPELVKDKDSKYKISSEVSDSGVLSPLSPDNRIVEYLRSSIFDGNVLVNKELLATVLEMSKVMNSTVSTAFFFHMLACLYMITFVVFDNFCIHLLIFLLSGIVLKLFFSLSFFLFLQGIIDRSQ